MAGDNDLLVLSNRGPLRIHRTPGHTLQATALVNEAYLKLARLEGPEWQGPTHFRAAMARARQ